MFRITLLTGAAWASTLLAYLIVTVAAAVGLQRASTSTAETAVFILVPLQLLTAISALVFVYFQTSLLPRLRRILWITIFALVQLGTWALAALGLLLVLNR